MQKENDLLQGNIGKSLIIFAIPFLLSNLVQACFGAVDMIIIGLYANNVSIAAISLGAQITMVMIRLANGLTVGGTILMAQYIGARRTTDARETISTILTLFTLISLIITALTFLFIRPILDLLNTPVESYHETLQYVLICSTGNIVIFGYNALSAILRGLGDSKRPFYFILIACAVNIVLDFLFIGTFHCGVAGAAWATVLAQCLSVIWAVIYLKKSNFLFDFRLKNFKIYRNKVPMILKLGIPVTIQDALTSTSFLFITSIVNTFGYVAAAAVGITSRFTMFAMLPSVSFAMALAAFVAQNIGAEQPKRAKKSFYIGSFLALAASSVFFIWSQCNPSSIMTIFGAQGEVLSAGCQYIRGFGFDYLLVAFVFCQIGFFNGCGKTRFAMVNGIISSILLRVPLTWLFGIYLQGGLWLIGLAAPLASAVQISIGFIYLKMNRWQTSVIGGKTKLQIADPNTLTKPETGSKTK